MNDNIFLLNEESEQTRPASAIFKSTVGLTMHNDELSVVFSTVENRKGYGKQYIPVTELQSVLSVLEDAKTNGIIAEDEQLTTAQTVKRSLIESEEGEIRFKTESSKGKKPTLLQSKSDFDSFVDTFSTYVPKILKKAEKAHRKLAKG